jgi:hypothetical protein
VTDKKALNLLASARFACRILLFLRRIGQCTVNPGAPVATQGATTFSRSSP